MSWEETKFPSINTFVCIVPIHDVDAIEDDGATVESMRILEKDEPMAEDVKVRENGTRRVDDETDMTKFVPIIAPVHIVKRDDANVSVWDDDGIATLMLLVTEVSAHKNCKVLEEIARDVIPVNRLTSPGSLSARLTATVLEDMENVRAAVVTINAKVVGLEFVIPCKLMVEEVQDAPELMVSAVRPASVIFIEFSVPRVAE